MGSSESFERLSRRQKAALVALLDHPSVTKAAAACGVSVSTIHRWLASDDAFQTALADAQQRAAETAFARLASRSDLAVECLEKNLSSGVAGAEVRAAVSWLQLLHRRTESQRYARLEAEVEALAEAIAAQDDGGAEGVR
jgi:AcrR family transcriptional regulator